MSPLTCINFNVNVIRDLEGRIKSLIQIRTLMGYWHK